MAKILLSGYYGFGNLGDEAILASTVEALRARDANIDISVLSQSPLETAASHNVRAFGRMSPFLVTRAIRGTDLVVFGGGSLLQDSTSFRSLSYYLAVIFLAKVLGKPLVVYANGIGPLSSGLGRKLVSRALETAKAVTLRDSESLDTLRETGFRKPAQITADPAFLLAPAPAARVEELLASHNIPLGHKLVWLALRAGQEDAFYETLIPVVDLLREKGLLPAQIAMQETDTAISRRLNDALRDSGRIPLPLVEDVKPSEGLGILGCGVFCLGMRLHALILSASAGIPFIGVDIDPKIGAFSRALGCPAIVPRSAYQEPSDPASIVSSFYDDIEDRKAALAKILPELRAAAAANVDMIMETLSANLVMTPYQ